MKTNSKNVNNCTAVERLCLHSGKVHIFTVLIIVNRFNLNKAVNSSHVALSEKQFEAISPLNLAIWQKKTVKYQNTFVHFIKHHIHVQFSFTSLTQNSSKTKQEQHFIHINI